MQTAVDILMDPRIPRMQEQRNGISIFFFSARGSDMRTLGDGVPSPEDQIMSLVYGPEVLGPFLPGRFTLIPPNPNPN